LTDNFVAEAFTAIVMGIISGLLMKITFEMFDILNAPPIFYFMIVFIAAIDFFAGMARAYVFGMVYSVSLLFFGVYIRENGAIITSVLSIVAYIAGTLYGSK
jgi:hypothetical protein